MSCPPSPPPSVATFSTGGGLMCLPIALHGSLGPELKLLSWAQADFALPAQALETLALPFSGHLIPYPSLTHSLLHSSLTPSLSFIPSLIHSFPHSLIHSLRRSLIQPLPHSLNSLLTCCASGSWFLSLSFIRLDPGGTENVGHGRRESCALKERSLFCGWGWGTSAAAAGSIRSGPLSTEDSCLITSC